MQSVSQFLLVKSGFPYSIQNAVAIASGSSLTVGYVVSGAPATLTITIEGIKNASGDVAVLDSYVGTASTQRTVALSDNYDAFTVTAVWTGGSAKTAIAVSITAT